MNTVKQLLAAILYYPWALVKRLFESKPDQKSAKKPTENRTEKAAQSPHDYDPPAGEEDVSSNFLIYQDMSHFETHPKELVALMGTKQNPTPAGREMIAFLENEADYAEMARTYSDDAIAAVRFAGTEFRYTDKIKSAIHAAVSAEYDRRNPATTPRGHGMGDDGRLG